MMILFNFIPAVVLVALELHQSSTSLLIQFYYDTNTLIADSSLLPGVRERGYGYCRMPVPQPGGTSVAELWLRRFRSLPVRRSSF